MTVLAEAQVELGAGQNIAHVRAQIGKCRRKHGIGTGT